MADPMAPDLTGLSAEERKIIEEVLARQRAEEQKESQISQAADKELDDIEKQIQNRKETALKLVGTQDDAICQICQKTKFADGIGHKCFYCQLRSCARCGGRTTSKNKNIWACSLCQKRQQILAKTGKWFQNATDPKNPGSQPGSQHDLASQQYPQAQQQQQQQHSIQPMTNGDSSYSMGPNGHALPSYDSHIPNGQPSMMQPQQNPLSSTSQTGLTNGVMPSQRQMQQPQPHIQQQQQPQPQQPPPQQKDSVVGGLMEMIGFKQQQQPQQSKPMPPQSSQPIAPLNGNTTIQQQQSTTRRQNTLHRQPSLNDRDYDRRQSRYDEPETSRRAIEEEKRRRGDPYLDSPRGSIRSSEHDERQQRNAPQRKTSDSRRRCDQEDSQRSQQIYEDDPSFQKQHRRAPPHVDARSPDASRSSRSRDSRGTGIRRQPSKSNDSQPQQPHSSTAYPPAVPPPEKPIGFTTPTTLKPLPSNQTRHRKSKLQSRTSMKEQTSSEDDEAPKGNTDSADKTADFTEKDLLLYIYGAQKAKMGPEMAKFDASLKSKSNLDLATTSRSSILPGNSLAAKIRQYLLSPVSWQPSADQRNLIGHMMLQRLKNDNGDLGLKVAGGRSTANGRLGAFVTKVRPGSVADIVGQLRPGDEVLEWNGHNLQNATPEHVRQIVTSSKNDSQVELIVSRSMAMPDGDDFLNIRRSATGFSDYSDYRLNYETAVDPTTGMRHSQTHSRPFLSARGVGENSPICKQQSTLQNTQLQGGYGIPRVRHFRTGPARQKFSAPEMPFSISQQQLIARQHSPLAMQATVNAAIGGGQHPIVQQSAQIFGIIEIALLYRPQERELIVTLLGAVDLPPRRDGAMRNPYAKLFLLPDRSEKSIRQTTVLAETLTPQWQESFYYRNLTEPVLMSRVLEVTVWDYDKYEANTFLGEVLIDFSTILLDNQPYSYTLTEMDDENPVRLRLRNRRYSSCTPPPRPYSEMAQYKTFNGTHLRKPREQYRARVDDDYETGEYDYGNHLPRSRTYDRSGVVVGGVRQNPCYCGGAADWNINFPPTQGNTNGHISDSYVNKMSSRYYSQRPHSATAIRKDPMMTMDSDTSPQDQQYRTRPRHRHSQDPSYRMSPLTSPYGPPDEPQPGRHKQTPRRYEQPPMDPVTGAPLPPQHQNTVLPPHMQSYNGEYGSDGSETMSVNSAQSMQNRQIRQQQQQQQQLPLSSEDGEGSSNSLRHQNYVNDDYGQSMSMEEATQSDTTMKSQTMKEMKERKKSLMTRLIPGRGAGGGLDNKRTGFARSEEVGVPESLSIPADRLGTTGNFQKQASKESTDSDNWPHQSTALNDTPLGTFVENLGPGQVVGRQVLASPVLGEIELAITLSKFGINVNIIRGKNLTVRPGISSPPAPYVKIYLMEGKQCISKAKTPPCRKTTAPLFEHAFDFAESFKHRILQITVLGDCGRMERKLFMGIAQIRLDDLAASGQPVRSWYKLFHNSSLTGVAPIRKDSENSLLGGQQQ